MTDIHTILSDRFTAAIEAAYGIEYRNVDPMIHLTNKPDFGDYQANLAMSLAKKTGNSPRNVARAIISQLKLNDICEKVEVAGPGFINLYLRLTFLDKQMHRMANHGQFGIKTVKVPQTIVVDYSAPNIAKEMHVGHLRSTVIGDAIVRLLMAQGHQVIRQNHMGDWGTQFGMLIEYLIDSGWTEKHGNRSSLNDLELRYQAAKRKFDSDLDFAKQCRQRVVALQAGEENTLKLWRYLVEESSRHFSDIYTRLGVLLQASDNCPESFYNPKLAEIVSLLDENKLLTISAGATVILLEGFKDQNNKPLPMIVRKSDGGYLYATTDLAALRYRLNELKADRLIYVTDARQSQHFAMLFAAAKRAEWVGKAHLQHVPFGAVLGTDKKPFKTRSGSTVKLIDLMHEAELRTNTVISKKNPEMPEEIRHEIAQTIGIAALKYADLSNDRIKDYIFNWNRMLALDGNTAPYLYNAYVRIISIFRKGDINRESLDPGLIHIQTPKEKVLALQLSQYAQTVTQASTHLEPHRLCIFLHELASRFHSFYESNPILKEAVTEKTKLSRLALCNLCAQVIHHGLNLLGMKTVDSM